MLYRIIYHDGKNINSPFIQEEIIIDYIKHIKKNNKINTIIRILKIIDRDSDKYINLYDPDELGGIEYRNMLDMLTEFGNYIYLYKNTYVPNPISSTDILLLCVLYDPKFPV